MHKPTTKTSGVGAIRAWVATLCIALGVCGIAFARDPSITADETALETHMASITAGLRCLVCQNQTIADSNAELARDLRRQVREMLRRGDDEATIIAYMSDRYGDFVLYRPPVKGLTLLLWFGPTFMLIAGFGALAAAIRRRQRAAPDHFEPDDPALFTDPHQF